MDAARKRNPINYAAERLKRAEKTLAPKVPADAEPNGDSALPSACDKEHKMFDYRPRISNGTGRLFGTRRS